MKSQQGQAAVEFALIGALFMFIVLGMIYGGLLFMDYLQYNNAARAIAREVAFTKNENVEDLKQKHFHPITSMYTPTLEINPTEEGEEASSEVTNDEEVTIKITFTITQPMGLTNLINFPPPTLNPIVYTMPIETVAQN